MTMYQFSPSVNAPFQFQPILGGNTYTVIITWNIYGFRYYVNIYNLSQTLIYCMPLIGSPPEYNISLLPPLDPITNKPWTSTMIYRPSTNNFEVTP